MTAQQRSRSLSKKENPRGESLRVEIQQEMNNLMLRRREELDELKKRGINPYPYGFDRSDFSLDVIQTFRDDAPQRTVNVAGRITSVRRMGKASFCHIQDSRGKIQIYLKRDDLGETYDALRLIDIGDIVGVTGFVFRTKMGEVSVHAQKFELLSKSLRPLPVVKEKVDETGNKMVFDPFADKELRYRQRYVDLAVNPDVREVFVKRAKIMRTIRRFFNERGYLEVESPILQPLYGGAFARPFVTHHNTLDVDLYLRIADELYLKRLLVGGFDAVYEFAKDFRNEGMDRAHNPEFTMLELYVAYRDYHWMMELVEQLLSSLVKEVNGAMSLTLGDHVVNFTLPLKRVRMYDAIKEHTGKSLGGKPEEELRALARSMHLDVGEEDNVGTIIDEIFSTLVQPNLIQPTFVTDYPIEMSPLAKKHRSEPGLVERFELFVGGQELCNAFSELNDPIDQRARFEEQMKLRAKGHEEAQVLDEDFLRALEYGMPPAAGLGIGMDRLTMVLTNQHSIRDVILFPQMKPEK